MTDTSPAGVGPASDTPPTIVGASADTADGWCDAEVWRQLKRRTLAKLRREIAPVDAATFARFLGAWHGIDDARTGPRRLEEALAQLEGLALPWSSLSRVLLPARVPDFRPAMLDMLCASGAIVWVGRSALGPRDGRIAIYRRSHAPTLIAPVAEGETPDGPVHAALLAHFERRGASFLTELLDAARPASSGEIEAALWELVWAGLVTNDTFAPLHALAHQKRGRRAREDLAGGRWSLVQSLRDATLADTERALARASLLLERYGAVSRDAAEADGVEGGFGPLYKVLRAMEEAGRVRRGHFVEGLAGAQFAQLGAVDRLRASRAADGETPFEDADARVLAAIDPANPYGALLPWPETRPQIEARPRRVPGAWVILVAGAPALYASANARQLVTLADEALARRGALTVAFRALHRLPRGARPRLVTVETIDEVPVRESSHRAALEASGFVSDYRGFTAMTNWKRS